MPARVQAEKQGATENITVRDLLRHTTGLTAHAYDDLVEQKIPFPKIMESLPLASIVSTPGNFMHTRTSCLVYTTPLQRPKQQETTVKF
jgi:CubicO group peptidase (beta-lactamase class C family)